MNVGYIRVSSKTQSYEIQKRALEGKVDRIYEEKKSGRSVTNRTELKRLLQYVRSGDTVYVYSISRLGRSLADIINISDNLSKRGINIISVKEGIDNSTNLGKVYLTIAGILAEVERELIEERTTDGREAAKAEGKTGGRPRKELPEQSEIIFSQYINHQISASTAQKILGLSRATFFRNLRRYRDELEKNQSAELSNISNIIELPTEEDEDDYILDFG